MSALLSRDFLARVGVVVDDITYDLLSDHYAHTLNRRVMKRVVDSLDDSGAQELSRIDTTQDDTLRKWLEVHVPSLGTIIDEEIGILLGEIADRSSEI